MFLKGQDHFATITHILPAQPGWRACFANTDFTDYIILPVIAWVFGTHYPTDEDEYPCIITVGLVYSNAIGGEMVLAAANEYFMCYLSPENDIDDEHWKKLLKRRLATLHRIIPEIRQEEDEIPIPEDTRMRSMRNVKRMPIEIDIQ